MAAARRLPTSTPDPPRCHTGKLSPAGFAAANRELAVRCRNVVAHIGRGRGEWKDGEHPAHWPAAAKSVIATHRSELDALWKRAGEKEARPEVLAGTAEAILSSAAVELLCRLYPKISREAIT